jgi:hypothetical protein
MFRQFNEPLTSFGSNHMMTFNRSITLIALCIALTACGGSPDGAIRQAPAAKRAAVATPPASSKTDALGSCVASRGKVGRPYTIRGVRYTPKRNPN